jgi:uncharacterized protein
MNSKIIERIKIYIEKEFKGETTGHDYWHMIRVWQMAKKISKNEGGNLFVIELGALLHDIDDWKFNSGSIKDGSKKATILLKKYDVDKDIIDQVCYIIDNISFKGALVKNEMKTVEGRIVQDADKLDAMGAVGVARVFAYGASKNREIYNPKIRPILHKSFASYKKGNGTSINHFYEKLLLLKNRMNTKTARIIAEQRHKFMKNYLKEFFAEWDGRK